MDFFWFLLATVLKLAFILGVSLLVYAPVFVLFERRQSAFFQDRVGPMMGGVKMPRVVLDNLPLLQMGAFGVAALCAAGSAAALVASAMGDASEDALILPISWGTVFLLSAVLGPAHLAIGMVLPHLFHHDRLTLFGGLHALFDALKAFTKEDIIPPNADRFLYSVAPILAMIPAFALGAVLPFGPDLYIDHLFETLPADADGTVVHLQVASLNVGILYMFAVGGTGVIAAAVAGYSSDNKFALLGGLRAASQMVSYEVTLGLSLVGCFMIYDTLRLEEMVQWQVDHVWGVVVQPLAFVLFFFASIAEYKRVPFDAPEGESEIVAGYFLEYSSGKWLMFMISEFLELATSSMLIAVLFFGGWDVPGLTPSGWEAFGYHLDLSAVDSVLVQRFAFLSDFANAHLTVVLVSIGAFIVKALILGIISIQIRWTLPRFRYDQIMQLCWKVFLPLSLANVLFTGVGILAFERFFG